MRFSVALPGWVVLGFAFAATVYSVMVVPAAPLGPIETTARLQAESLARDGDFVYDERDRLRFASKGWTDREAKVLLAFERGELRYHRPAPYAVALAPFVRLAPERGPYVLNLLILAGLALALVNWIGHDNAKGASTWTAALLFGTPVFATCRAAWPELLTAALLAGAYLLTRDRGSSGPPGPESAVPEAGRATGAGAARHGLRIVGSQDDSPARRGLGGPVLRWLGVGALTALAVLQEPLCVVFFPVFVWMASRRRGEAAWAPTVAGFALVLLVAWFGGGSLFVGVGPGAPETGLAIRSAESVEEIRQWTQRLESVESSAFVVDPRLWFWNAVYTLGGRTVGAAVGFVALLVFAIAGRSRRGLLWGALAAVALLALALEPFNFFGGPEALGNRRLLPALVVCFFAVRASLPVWPAFVAGSLGAVVIAPLWLDLGSHPLVLRTNVIAAPIAERLPFETSQRYAPVSGEVVSRLLLIRPLNDGIKLGSGRDQFVLRSGRRGELMVAAGPSLAHLDFEFGAGAGSELEMEGGAVENLLFRPDGGVTFRVDPGAALIRHRVWGRDEVYDVYLLEFWMPGQDERDQPFSVSAERSD